MFCRNCGKQLEDNAIICPQCGLEVTPMPRPNGNYTNNRPCGDNRNNMGNGTPNYGANNGPANGASNSMNGNAYAYAPRPAPRDKSNTIAVVGFVLSFFFAIAGLVCSIIGYNKAKKEGLDNKELAIAGIVISAVEIGICVLTFMLCIGLPFIIMFIYQIGAM